MTVAENLRMAELRGMPRRLRIGLKRSTMTRYREMLARLNMRLENRLTASMGTLSGGQRQAITLLMATMCKPKLLLLDEHTAALDPKAAEPVMLLTNQIVRGNSLTTMMVTHSMDQALEQGDRTIMVHRGELLADLSGPSRSGLNPDDLLKRFNELKYTVEFQITPRPGPTA
jgi:putative ABC transport system ATP-binding protein